MRLSRRKGILALIGGAEKRTGKKRLLRRIVKLRPTRKVVLIPSASQYPREVGRDYKSAFYDLGVEKVDLLDVRSREEADSPEHSEKVDAADLIFISGGDQVRLVDVIGGTELLEHLWRRFRQGATIAGTSAGAAAASDPMIFDGQEKGLYKGRVGCGPGFGFIGSITIDTHFVVRYRIPRLAQFLASGRSSRGIGLAENTAIIINPDGIAEVAGSGTITLLNSSRMTYNNFSVIEDDKPVSVHGLKLGFLSEGMRFNLNKWSVVA